MSFLLGFVACLVFLSLGLILSFVWNKHSFLIRLLVKNPTTKDSKNVAKTNVLIWILVPVIIVLGGLVSSFLIFKQNELSKSQTQYQNKRVEQREELLASIRTSSLVFLMRNILDKVDDELKNNPKRTLSDETIARIAALSYSFKPYRYLEGDSLSEKKYSPERGQLLLALSKMNIDSSSFDKIKSKAPFSSADLREADLIKANLRGADLRKANLNDADLRWANLNEADLRGANLRGANLRKANLRGADLNGTDMRWADLNGADLKRADLNGADLTSAKLRKADLSGSDFKWADLNGALLNEANLAGVDLSGTDLRRANLNKANLSGVELFKVAVEEENWLEKLNEWRVTGAKEIQERYKIVDDITGRSKYRLLKIED